MSRGQRAAGAARCPPAPPGGPGCSAATLRRVGTPGSYARPDAASGRNRPSLPGDRRGSGTACSAAAMPPRPGPRAASVDPGGPTGGGHAQLRGARRARACAKVHGHDSPAPGAASPQRDKRAAHAVHAAAAVTCNSVKSAITSSSSKHVAIAPGQDLLLVHPGCEGSFTGFFSFRICLFKMFFLEKNCGRKKKLWSKKTAPWRRRAVATATTQTACRQCWWNNCNVGRGGAG